MFFQMFLFFFGGGGGGGGGGGRKPWIIVVAQLQHVAISIDDSHTVQMYNYSTDN